MPAPTDKASEIMNKGKKARYLNRISAGLNLPCSSLVGVYSEGIMQKKSYSLAA
jgi:hypothetical protein